MTDRRGMLREGEWEFLVEWAREWHKGLWFIGPARKVTQDLGIEDGQVSKMIGGLRIPFLEQMGLFDLKPSEEPLHCPWKTKEEFEARLELIDPEFRKRRSE